MVIAVLEMIANIAAGFWDVLGEMAPYLLLGFVVAGVLHVFIPQKMVERQLGGRRVWPVVKATIFGIPLPLCSCGVIPVAASLRRSGASRGATTSFLLSTPQTGVDSILVTYSLLGPVFAVFRPLAALVTGVLGGSLVSAVECDEEVKTTAGSSCEDNCGLEATRGAKFSRALSYGLVTLPRDIGGALLVGLFIAALIGTFVPNDFLAGVLGGGILAMLVMMALGIPVYVCATGSVPVAAALIAKGVSPGAALVFLMTGPATNAAALATVWKIMGKCTTFIYLGTIVVTALAAGFALDFIFKFGGTVPALTAPTTLSTSFKSVSAVALLVILGFAVLKRSPYSGAAPAGETEALPDGEAVVLRISGMTCSHCVESVSRALRECPGVQAVTVSLQKGEGVVKGEDLDADELVRAVEGLGYKAAVSEYNAPNARVKE